MATTTSELELIISANAAQFKGELAKVQGQLDGLSASAKKADGFFSGFKSALPDISKMALGLGAASVAFSALSNAIGGVLAKETSLAEFSAITGVVGDSLATFGDAAVDLSNKFGGDAVSQIESFKGVLSRLGPDFASSSDAVRMMGDSINTLAKAGGIDATQAMDALTTSMLQFGVDLSDPNEAATKAAEMMNVLAAGAQAGAAEIPQVSEAIKAAGVAASGANVSFEETNAAIQVLAAGGKVGSEAGISLRNVLGSLVTQSKEGETALAKMGLSSSQLGKVLTTQGLNAALELLSGNLNKVGGEDKQLATLMALFGKENAAAAGILIKGAAAADGQTSALKRMTEAVTGTNSAYEQADTVMNTTAAKLERLASVLSNTLQSALSVLVDVGAFLLDNFGAIAEVLKILAPPIAVVAAGWGAYAAAQWIATSANTAFSTATTAVQGALSKLWAAMLANPVLTAVAALTAGISAVISITDSLNESTLSQGKNALDAANATLKQVEAEKKAVQSKMDHKKEMLGLLETYTELGAKTNRTREESERYNAAQKKLSAEYPGLIVSGASYADNMTRIRTETDNTKNSIDNLTRSMAALGVKQREAVNQQMTMQYVAAKEQLAVLLKDMTGNIATDLTGKSARDAQNWANWITADLGSAKTLEEIDGAIIGANEVIMSRIDGLTAQQKTELMKQVEVAADAMRKIVAARLSAAGLLEAPKPTAAPTGGGTPTGTKSKEKDDGWKQADALLQHTAELAKIRLANDRFAASKIRDIEDKLLNDRIALAGQYEKRKDELAELMRDKEKRDAQEMIRQERNKWYEIGNEVIAFTDKVRGLPDPFEKLKDSTLTFANALKAMEPSVQSVADVLGTAFTKERGEGLKAFLKAIGNQLIIFVEGALLAGSAYSTISALMTAGITAIKDAPMLIAAEIALEAARGWMNSLAVGTAFVPNDQIAQIHRGEMVIPRPFAEDVRSGEIMIAGKDKEGPSARIRRKGGQRIDVRADVGISSFRSARRKSAYYDNARAF